MTNKNFTPHIVKFYSKVGAPEMTFFISLISLFFIPFIFDIRNQLLETVLLTIFIFALFYLIYDSNNKIGRNYAVLLTIILILEWLRYFDFATIGYLNTISQIVIMLVSFYFVFKSIFYSKKIDVNTLLAAVSGYLLIGIALGSVVFIYHGVNEDSFSFASEFNPYEAYYYSFITMSTLGYGDIVPKSIGAKGLSILITLIGQFYMVIVMGLIIGKLISPQQKDK